MPVELGYETVPEFIDKIEDFSHFQEKAGITSGVEHIWGVFLKDMERILNFDLCALFLVNEETHEFELYGVAPEAMRDECLKELDLQIECGVFSWVIDRRLPSVLPSTVFKKRTAVMLPLCTVNRTLGAVLSITQLEESAITMETLKLLGILARQCSLVMENAFLYDHLRKEHESLQKAQSQIIQTEKLASIGRLTRAASHEILNPLNIISGYAHLLKLGAERDSKPSRYLAEIIKESGRIAKVVSGLMQFKGSDAVKTSSADINAVVEKALSLTEYAAKFNKVAVSFAPMPEIPPVVGDSEDLMQVIISIINNSLEAMPEGGDLEIGIEAYRVNEAGQEGKGFVKVKITDTGCGIPEDIRERVLEPFVTTKGDKAMGLGLYMAYCVVQRCGGTIQIGSGPGERGACVTLALPLADKYGDRA